MSSFDENFPELKDKWIHINVDEDAEVGPPLDTGDINITRPCGCGPETTEPLFKSDLLNNNLFYGKEDITQGCLSKEKVKALIEEAFKYDCDHKEVLLELLGLDK